MNRTTRVNRTYTSAELPYPEGTIMQRIGPMTEEDPIGVYEQSGQGHRKLIESLLPDDWTWSGKRVLDFGCGVGRILRQFAPETGDAEFWGCDIDGPSVEWLRENLSPPFEVFESDEAPGLPQEDGYFDLIYAFSVYTHLTDHWAGWLLEHHRVLKDGGFLVATFLGEGMCEPLLGEKWDEGRIGMNGLTHGNHWDLGGPTTLHSEWWIRAHWGRAFDIVKLHPHGGGSPPSGHGLVAMRKKPVSLTVEDLEALEPDEPREITALQHHVRQLAEESARLRGETVRLSEESARLREELRLATERASQLEHSASWRLTAPLRSAKRRLRRR